MRIEPGLQFDPALINATLVRAGFGVSHLSTQHRTLEDVFLDLTSSPAEEMEHVSL